MCEGWNKELTFTGIPFRPGFILVNCAWRMEGNGTFQSRRDWDEEASMSLHHSKHGSPQTIMESFYKQVGGQIPHDRGRRPFPGSKKPRSSLINYRFGGIPVHVHREKLRAGYAGRPTEDPEEIAKDKEGRTSRDMDLLPTEKLNELHLELLWLKWGSETQEDNTPTL